MKNLIILTVLTLAGIRDLRKNDFPYLYQIILISILPICFNYNNLWGALIAIPFFIVDRHGRRMGGGDAKAVAIFGALIGLLRAAISVCIACALFILVSSIIMAITGRKDSRFPFMPYLAAAFFIQLILEVH